MEKKKSKGKIIALVCSLVAVLLVTTGVTLAATGVLSGLFASDKDRAFELLAQMPERMTASALDEQLGTRELTKAIGEKGMDVNCKVTNINAQDSNVDLSGMSMDWGLQIDVDSKKMGNKVVVGKDGSNLTAEGYFSLDEKKIVISLPELLPNKAFSFAANDEKSQESLDGVSAVLTLLPELQESFSTFIEEQGDVLYDNTECTKINGGYQIKIPKIATDQFLNSLQTYVNEQSSTIGNFEHKLKIPRGSVSAGLSMAISQITANSMDVVVDVYGDGDILTGVSTSLKINQEELKLQCTFTKSDSQNTAKMEVEGLKNGTSAGKIIYSRDAQKGDVCEDDMKFEFVSAGTSQASCEIKQTLNVKNNNAYSMNLSLNGGNETVTLNTNGSVKNLEPGKCMTIKLDEFNMQQTDAYSSSQKVALGLEFTLAVLDSEIKTPSGEEVALTQENAYSTMQTYASEIQSNLMNILNSWGISGMGMMPSTGGSDSGIDAYGYSDDSYSGDTTDTYSDDSYSDDTSDSYSYGMEDDTTNSSYDDDDF